MTKSHPALPIILRAFAAVAAIVLAVAAVPLTGYRIVINPTPSVRPGLYIVNTHDRVPRDGGMVLFDPPPAAAAILYGRGYLKPGAPLIKRIYAVAGERYCITDAAISVRGVELGPVSLQDSIGRPLPRLRGCFTVPAGGFLPLGLRIPNSYDARYFGAVDSARIIGTARLLIGL